MSTPPNEWSAGLDARFPDWQRQLCWGKPTLRPASWTSGFGTYKVRLAADEPSRTFERSGKLAGDDPRGPAGDGLGDPAVDVTLSDGAGTSATELAGRKLKRGDKFSTTAIALPQVLTANVAVERHAAGSPRPVEPFNFLAAFVVFSNLKAELPALIHSVGK